MKNFFISVAIFLSFVPLTLVLLIPSLVVNGALGEISPKLLIYRDITSWGAESFLGSVFLLALIVALSISIVLTIRFVSSVRIKKISLVIYFLSTVSILIFIFGRLPKSIHSSSKSLLLLPLLGLGICLSILLVEKLFSLINKRLQLFIFSMFVIFIALAAFLTVNYFTVQFDGKKYNINISETKKVDSYYGGSKENDFADIVWKVSEGTMKEYYLSNREFSEFYCSGGEKAKIIINKNINIPVFTGIWGYSEILDCGNYYLVSLRSKSEEPKMFGPFF